MSASAQRKTAHEWYMLQPNALGFEQWVSAQERAGTRFTPRRGFTEQQWARQQYSMYEQRLWHDALERRDANAQRQQMIRSMRQNRQIAGLFAGQLIGGGADIAGDLGMNKTATVLGALGQGVSAGFGTAATITMMGGSNPYSAAAGLIVGIGTAAVKATTGLMDLAEKAKECAEAQERYAKKLESSATSMEQGRFGLKQDYEAGRAQLNKRLKSATEEREWYEDKYEELRKEFFSMESPESYERHARWEAETRKARTADD